MTTDGEKGWSVARIAFWSVVVGAALLRVVDLDIKPLHSDESVNGWFMERLLDDLYYRYNPTDYHGPLLYFVNVIPMLLLGMTEVGLRVSSAFAGTAAVASIGLYRPWLGRWGVVVAAALLAVSAPDVYFSRTAIHEVWLVLFSLLAGAAMLHYLRSGGTRHLVGLAAAWALAFATKETVVISGFCVVMGILVAALPVFRDGNAGPWMLLPARRYPRWFARRRFDIAIAGLVGVGIVVLLFSSFLTRPLGVLYSIGAYLPAGERGWVQYGVTGRNQGKDAGYFVAMWGWWAPSLLLAVPALLVGVIKRYRFTIFAATWFAISLLIYELIPYKTPWCALQIGLPLFLLAGSLVPLLTSWDQKALRIAGALIAVMLSGWAVAEGARQSYDSSLVRYDDSRIPFVYVQTRRMFGHLPTDLFSIRAEHERDKGPSAMTKLLVVEAKNPLRWYVVTRDWPSGQRSFPYNKWPEEEDKKENLKERLKRQDIIVVARRWEPQVREILGGEEYRRRAYLDRPGKVNVAFYRESVMNYLGDPFPLVDGGLDPLVAWPEAPASFFPPLRNKAEFLPSLVVQQPPPEQTRVRPANAPLPNGRPFPQGPGIRKPRHTRSVGVQRGDAESKPVPPPPPPRSQDSDR